MQHSATFDFGRPLRGIRSGLQRKNALRRLGGSLARFTDAELDGLLAKLGMRRGALFSAFRGNAAHRQLMAHMMAHFGVDSEQASERCWGDIRQAESACARCANKGRCRRWLEWGRANDAPSVFCPNAALFRQLCLALRTSDVLEGAAAWAGAKAYLYLQDSPKTEAARVEAAWTALRGLSEKSFWCQWRETTTEWLEEREQGT